MNASVFRLAGQQNGNTIRFAIVFVVINLHVLRNVALIPYIAVYLAVSVFVGVQFIRKILSERRGDKWSPTLVLLSVAVLGAITSLAFISIAGTLLGLSRFLFAIPILFALYVYTDSVAQLRKNIVTIVTMFTIACLTLPLQLLTGPITWFDSSSERADLTRFSSLLGSLTALGIAVGSYIVLVQVFRARTRFVVILLVAFSALISLQKSALVNLALGLVLLGLLNRRAFAKLAAAVVGLAALGVAAYALIPALKDRIDVSLVSFGVADGSGLNYDYTISAAIVDRLVALPLLNFQALADIGNPLVYVFGGGFGMASTALVPEGDSLAPMAHNQFAEAITAFGFLGGVALSAMMVLILVRLIVLYRRTRESVILTVTFAYLLFLLNSVFANGTLYQPASASVFYLAMFVAIAGHRLTPTAALPNAALLDTKDKAALASERVERSAEPKPSVRPEGPRDADVPKLERN
jgi:hypothetical protein